MAGSQDIAEDPRNAAVLVWINGALVPRAEALVSVFDGGFIAGDGVWEGLRLVRGKWLFLDRHLDRLFAGARAIDLEIGLSRAELLAALDATRTANAMEDGVHARLMVTRGIKRTPSQDPRQTIGQIIGEALEIHHLGATPAARARRIAELLAVVGLDPEQARRYPHEFSGGQRQRIGIARALAVEPRLIVCDEPVSALDVSVQAQIINLLQDLQRKSAVAYLFVAHDLAVIEHISRRVMVMYLGKIVESGPAKSVVQTPAHPYTKALISAVPQIDPETRRPRIILPGEIPSPMAPPPGCPFHPRCPIAEPRCRTEPPALREIAPAHFASCHLAG